MGEKPFTTAFVDGSRELLGVVARLRSGLGDYAAAHDLLRRGSQRIEERLEVAGDVDEFIGWGWRGVVVDGGGDQDHRDVERGIPGALGVEHLQREIGVEAADDEQRVDLELLDGASEGVQLVDLRLLPRDDGDDLPEDDPVLGNS